MSDAKAATTHHICMAMTPQNSLLNENCSMISSMAECGRQTTEHVHTTEHCQHAMACTTQNMSMDVVFSTMCFTSLWYSMPSMMGCRHDGRRCYT